ncbi:MAG: mechanosensitive ion channel domain-containing protein [Gemmatimonadota bacterium]
MITTPPPRRLRGADAATVATTLLLIVLVGAPEVGQARPPPVPTPTVATALVPPLQAAQETEPLSPEQAQADEEIRARLQALYDRIGSLPDVTVEVEAGIVRLRGRALSLEARQQAVELAREAEGVVFVEDELRVVTDLGQRLEPAMSRIQDYAMGAVAFLPLLAVALLIVGAFVVLGSRIARWEGPHLRLATTPFTRGLLGQIVRFAFTMIGLLVALELLDATALVGAVLGAAGVFGLAVGFAFKDIVENHLAGIMLSLRQPFAPNDHILVDSHEGKVVRLTTRETILMTLAGNHLRIPNAEIFRSVVTNFTRNPRRRFEFTVSVGTRDDLLAAQDAGLKALEGMTGVMEDPVPSAQVEELGDSWVTLRFFGWVDQLEADFGRVRSEAIRRVKLALEEAEVTMPAPEYAVVLREGAPPPGPHAVDEGKDERRKRDDVPEAPEPAVDHRRQDVSVDHALDEQIEEDRRSSEEGDLLRTDPDPSADVDSPTDA